MTRSRRTRYRPIDTAAAALRWAERRRDGADAGTPARARYEEEARRLREEYDARASESPAPGRAAPVVRSRRSAPGRVRPPKALKAR